MSNVSQEDLVGMPFSKHFGVQDFSEMQMQRLLVLVYYLQGSHVSVSSHVVVDLVTEF